jgi:hypothetical protein
LAALYTQIANTDNPQTVIPGWSEGPDPESKDSPMCNSTSEVRSLRSRLEMTWLLLSENVNVGTASSEDFGSVPALLAVSPYAPLPPPAPAGFKPEFA